MGQLDGIDVFARVVQLGSFTGAARSLGMPVTTVSGRIAALERRLGTTLIHRTTRRLSITDEGRAYFERCVRALDEMTVAEKELSAARSEPEGCLRITAAPDIGHLVLPSLTREFLRRYPETQVELILTNRVVDLVGEGVDLAIRAGNLKDSTSITRKFRDLEMGLWASRAYAERHPLPGRPSELKDHAFIAFAKASGRLGLSRGRRTVEVPVHPRIIVDDLEAVKTFVSGGDGVGVLSSLMCESEIELVRVLPQWKLELGLGPRSRLFFIYPAQRFVAPKVQAFIDLALEGQGRA